MSNDWAGLDDTSDASQPLEEGVQYIGMVEDNEPAQPVRTPRRPVQRVAPVSSSYPAQRPMVNPGGGRRMSGREEPLIYYPTATGAQLALNAEAVNNIRRARPQSIDGKPAYRIQPGQYVMVVPGKGPAPRVDESAAGTFNDLLNDLATTGGGTASGDRSGLGTTGAEWVASFGRLLDPLARLAVGVTTTVLGAEAAERQANLDRRRMEIEAEAAAASRVTAAEAATQVHQETMARIRQERAELAELQRAQDQTAAAQSALGPAAPAAGGTSPVVWILLAVMGLGGIGGLVWFLSSRKSKKDE